MTKSEFQDLQQRAASSGTTLKEFLRGEGVAYSTYHYWCKKVKAEAETLPIAPISIRHRERMTTGEYADSMSAVDLPGVTLAFPNGVRAHFGRNGFRKDKSGEKLAESEEDLLEHRTDGTDAFDTLYIGCEKFPYHDSFSLSTSGVL